MLTWYFLFYFVGDLGGSCAYVWIDIIKYNCLSVRPYGRGGETANGKKKKKKGVDLGWDSEGSQVTLDGKRGRGK